MVSEIYPAFSDSATFFDYKKGKKSNVHMGTIILSRILFIRHFLWKSLGNKWLVQLDISGLIEHFTADTNGY